MAITVFEETRQILETRFFAGEPYDFEVFLEGRVFVQPTGSDWVILSIEDAGSTLKAFGNKDDRKTSGTMVFKLSVQHGNGSKRAREIADKINDVMSFTAGGNSIAGTGTLYVMAGNMRKVSDDDSGYLNYIIDFSYDYYTS
mgnify:CR=1 FL=1|jgi:hypothetical protein